MKNCLLLFPILVFSVIIHSVQAQNVTISDVNKSSLRNLVPDNWYLKSSAMLRVGLKRGIRLKQLSSDSSKLDAQLDTIVRQGYTSIAIYATPHGGKSFNGLDALDRYNIDPYWGTMDDFKRLVRQAHRKHLAVLAIDNLGYCSIDAPHFIKACSDAGSGKMSEEVKWFNWADSSNAEPPMKPDRYYLGGGKSGKWVYNSLAKKYYWSNWSGIDKDSVPCSLPQYSWSPEWQKEIKKIVRFWMNTGIDGMLQDAVTWYTNYNWQIGKDCITDIISSYGNVLLLPEGAGGFHEDPVPWITEGGWNCVINYGIGIWWEMKNNKLFNAIENHNPSGLEASLRDYHDRVVAEGGVLLIDDVGADIKLNREQFYLYAAFVIATGHLYSKEMHSNENITMNPAEHNWETNFENMNRNDEFVVDRRLADILHLKNAHPAFHQLSRRQKLETNDDNKYYAFIQKSVNNEERILCVFNFQNTGSEISVDMSGVNSESILDLAGSKTIQFDKKMQFNLPAYGYAFYKIN